MRSIAVFFASGFDQDCDRGRYELDESPRSSPIHRPGLRGPRLAQSAQPEHPAETSQQGTLAVALEPIDLVTPHFLESHAVEISSARIYAECRQPDCSTDTRV